MCIHYIWLRIWGNVTIWLFQTNIVPIIKIAVARFVFYSSWEQDMFSLRLVSQNCAKWNVQKCQKLNKNTVKNAFVETWIWCILRHLGAVENRYRFCALTVLVRQSLSPKSISTPGWGIPFLKELTKTYAYVVISASVCWTFFLTNH